MQVNNLLFLIPDYIDKDHNFIDVFGFQIYYYAIAITLGMLTCVLAVIPLFKRRGMKPDFLLDLMIGIIPCSIVCARLWYVLFDIKSFHSFKEVIDIRSGGLAIYGGVAGGALGIVIVCLIHKKSITKVFDFGAVMLPLGQAIGRWGNYFNQEVYGAVDPKAIGFPISVYIQDAGEYHYALFFWESVANIILFALLYLFLFKYRGKRNGYATAFYFIGYGVIRAIMEPLRDAQYNLPLFGSETLGSEWASILLILGGLAVLAAVFVRDFNDCGKNFKKYFAYMFAGKKEPQKAVRNKAEHTAPSEAAAKDSENGALPVGKVRSLKVSKSDKTDAETPENTQKQ
ncbi:MAG: prolipoprotein diacylglyceryl transferase [Clostridia bacterium]|nr:prolipoprotein diacylglyceryl transferase [Clostridia bacterium]